MPTPGSLVGVVGVAHVASGNITGVFGQTPTPGNTLVCLCINHAGTASSSVPTRTVSGSWSLLPTAITNSLTADKQAAGAYIYGPAIGGGSDTAPTFTVTNGGGGSTCLIFEFYGVVNFMDANGTKAAVASASSGATRTTGNLVPTYANDLDIAFLMMTSGATVGSTPTYTWNNGFSTLYNEPINANTISASVGTLVVSSNAAVTPSCTFAVTGGTALGTMMLSFSLQLIVVESVTINETSNFVVGTPSDTEQATVNMNSTSGFSIGTPVNTIPEFVSMNSTSSFGVAATQTEQAAVSMNDTSSFSVATPSDAEQVTATMNSTSSFSVATTQTEVASVAMNSTSSFSIAVTETEQTSASMNSTSSFSVAVTQTEIATSSLNSTSAFSVAANVTETETVSINSTSSFGVGENQTELAAVSMNETSSFGITASAPGVSVTMNSTSSFGVTANVTEQATVSANSTSSFVIAASVTEQEAATMNETSSFGITASVTEQASVSMTQTSAFSVATPSLTMPESAVMASTSIFGIGASISFDDIVSMNSASSFIISSTHIDGITSSMNSTSSFAAFASPVTVSITLDLTYEVQAEPWVILVDDTEPWCVAVGETSWSFVVEKEQGMADQQILQVEYTKPVTITNRTLASLDPVTVSIAISPDFEDKPDDGVYLDAEILDRNEDQIVAHVLVDRTQFTDGTYYEWVRVNSSPEIVPRRVATLIIGPTP